MGSPAPTPLLWGPPLVATASPFSPQPGGSPLFQLIKDPPDGGCPKYPAPHRQSLPCRSILKSLSSHGVCPQLLLHHPSTLPLLGCGLSPVALSSSSVSPGHGGVLFQLSWPLLLAVPANSLLHSSVSIALSGWLSIFIPWGGRRERCGTLSLHPFPFSPQCTARFGIQRIG